MTNLNQNSQHQLIDKKGTRWHCRLIAPKDAQPLTAFFASLSDISRKTFQPHPLTSAFASYIARRFKDRAHLRAVIVNAEKLKNEKIVGYAFISRLPLTSLGYFGIAISDTYQGRGLSSGLMEYLFETAKNRGLTKIYLNVMAINRVAIQSYTKRGFQIIDPPFLLSKSFTLFELWSNGTLSELWQPRSPEITTTSTVVWMSKTI